MIRGLSERMTKGNVCVLRLHYSVDPDKRPGTEEGDRWLAEAISGYPGGMASPRWRKEMEVDYGAFGGARLFPDFEIWQSKGKVVIPPFEPLGYKLYGSYDHGWRSPACYHVHGIGNDGQIVTLWEFYGSKVPVSQICEMIKGNDITTQDGRKFKGNPFAGQELMKIADPSIWAEDTPMLNQTNKSTSHLFEMEGVYFIRGERGGDTTVAEWLYGHFWANPEDPLYRITSNCQKLIWELTRLRHREISTIVQRYKEDPEALVDRDNHAWDGLKMFLKIFPPTPQARKETARPNTFNWWLEQVKRQKKGLPVQTFRRDMI